MTTNKNHTLFCNNDKPDMIVYVLARGVDLQHVTQITFTELGSGKNVVMPEYLFKKNYTPYTTIRIDDDITED